MPDAIEYWFADYVKTYLERDVRRLINVQDLSIFQRFIKLCAGRSGNLLNRASLAADTGISETTCNRWLSLLEQSGLIVLLKPYYNNFNKRQVKSPKLFFLDTGLLCHLLMIKKTQHLETHPLLGAIIETYAITEIYKTILNEGVDPECYFWRDSQGCEVDLIVTLAAGKLLPFEIKAGQTITSKLVDPLKKWCQLSNSTRGIVLYGGTKHQQRDMIDIMPIDIL